ncbi:MAG: hypothetical protein KAS17_09315 [Victivallaceae bacterium]|nr:hypothetical protein [Victivallaceae bacterium]
MTKKQQNNYPETGYLTEIRTMISGLRVIYGSCCGLLLKNYLCYGATKPFNMEVGSMKQSISRIKLQLR